MGVLALGRSIDKLFTLMWNVQIFPGSEKNCNFCCSKMLFYVISQSPTAHNLYTFKGLFCSSYFLKCFKVQVYPWLTFINFLVKITVQYRRTYSQHCTFLSLKYFSKNIFNIRNNKELWYLFSNENYKI